MKMYALKELAVRLLDAYRAGTHIQEHTQMYLRSGIVSERKTGKSLNAYQ